MPTIYDNINEKLIDGLHTMLQGAKRADFCVGYFNLRGWGKLESTINQLTGEDGDYCRLLVGMALSPQNTVKRLYSGSNPRITQQDAYKMQARALEDFARQLTIGSPSNEDEANLRKLVAQLKAGRLRVKIYTRHPLHAKLYLAHRTDNIAAIAGFVGSSNLTFAGLSGNGELNVDVVEQDAAQKLKEWFNKRWDDEWSVDITDELCKRIDESWAGGIKPPYHIYIKTAWHLSREAIEGSDRYQLPHGLEDNMLEHQKQAVALAAQRLNKQNGVLIGDVVGLGKTLLATAVAKVFQEDLFHNVLIICPPALIEMWRGYIHQYRLAAEVLSLGKVRDLEKMQWNYQLVVLDESHNLRSQKSARHRHVRDYIRKKGSKVIMLTATPYNKAFDDIIGQLLLFNGPDDNLGIVPEQLIKKCGGRVEFGKMYPGTPISSLAAFEKSKEIDDWRELMRLFMVRRTRAHIKQNYADYDEAKERHYLTLKSGEKFYFPLREPRRLAFSMKSKDDQYAKLYSEQVVETLGGLIFPRYGLRKYVSKDAPEDNEIIRNLSRAGQRLRGFACIGLFKRLESSGEAFLLSLKRHIIRNIAMITAYHEGAIFIGDVLPTHMDEAGEEDDTLLSTEEGETIDTGEEEAAVTAHTWEGYQNLGATAYQRIKEEENKFSWLDSAYLSQDLIADLEADAKELIKLLNIVPDWQADDDRKLVALKALCKNTHGKEKLLIFTQFKDTAKYIHRNMQEDMADIALVHGDSEQEDIKKAIRKFSPRSNNEQGSEQVGKTDSETRVLISTDKLSEGVNLQDAHIIVNYDLPWAIIRLVQRAGRVDRIGQKADTIYCYSAQPEDGVEDIIKLRARLNTRMKENANLVGSDEVFFDDNAVEESRQIYDCTIDLEQEDEGDTDLVSRAYDIWQQAIKRDPALENIIQKMPDVVYSAKKAEKDSVIAYIKNAREHYTLAEVDSKGEIISQSQYTLLDKLACAPEEQGMDIAKNHHDLVAKMVAHCRESALGGQLGGPRNIRRRVYERLINLSQERIGTLLPHGEELGKICELVSKNPLMESARGKIRRQLQSGIGDEEFIKMMLELYNAGELCVVATESEEEELQPQIICSMGLNT